MSKRLRDQVSEFHRAFAVPVLDKPQVPDRKRIQLRLRLIGEEFFELLEACGGDSTNVEYLKKFVFWEIDRVDESKADLVEIVDAFGDIDYVVEGGRLEFGVDGEPIADEIQRSNMAKIGAVTNEFGKVLKPAGWTPPDIAGELIKQGWSPA